jgi:hypothetical protein
LPAGWNAPEPFEQVVEVAGVELFLVGLVASREDGGDVVGSAAEPGSFAVARAYFELLERCAVIDALQKGASTYALLDEAGDRIGDASEQHVFPMTAEDAPWAYSKSNGVAAGPDWQSACRSARAELVERHAVLTSWYGLAQPSKLDVAQDTTFAALGELYDVETYAFAATRESLDVIGAFGFPKAPTSPLIIGFGAGLDHAEALLRAQRECLQRLAFLWGEEIPTEEPAFNKSPDYHQEYFLWPAVHERLRSWLGGGHLGRAMLTPPQSGASEAHCFVDLTPRHLEHTAFRVAKAMATYELPLVFGRGHPRIDVRDERLLVHPIA